MLESQGIMREARAVLESWDVARDGRDVCCMDWWDYAGEFWIIVVGLL